MTAPVLGSLTTEPVLRRPDLVAPAVLGALHSWEVDLDQVLVAEIDPDLADTAALSAAHHVPLSASANCVVVLGRREGVERLAGCVVLATTRADVNGLVKRTLDVRKCSFLAMDRAVAETGMEFGGITPVGLPTGWRTLVDAAVLDVPVVVVGSGLRRSKLVLPGAALAGLAGAQVLTGLGIPTTGA